MMIFVNSNNKFPFKVIAFYDLSKKLFAYFEVLSMSYNIFY